MHHNFLKETIKDAALFSYTRPQCVLSEMVKKLQGFLQEAMRDAPVCLIPEV